jgi:hypothetical protein
MWTRLKLDLWLTLASVLIPLQSAALPTDLVDPDEVSQTTVEVEYPAEILLPYKERRPDWGFVFGAKYENFAPNTYESPIDGNTYQNLFGENAAGIFALEGGIKYNTRLASLTAEVSFGQGSVADSRIGDDVTLRMTKTAAHFGLWLDMIWPEPYVVPYAQADVFQIDFTESDSLGSESGTSQVCFGYTAGALIQLNWLDPDQALRALATSGLNNTYIDIFVAQSTGSGTQPDFGSDPYWGAGFKLEF